MSKRRRSELPTLEEMRMSAHFPEIKRGHRKVNCPVKAGEGDTCPGFGPKHHQDRVKAAIDWREENQ